MGQTQRQTRRARQLQKAKKKMKEGKECVNKTKDRHTNTNKACCSFQPSKKADVHCLLRELGEELTMT